MKVTKGPFDSMVRAEGFIEGVEMASEVAEATGGKTVTVLGEAYRNDNDRWYVDVDYDVGAVNLGFGDDNEAEGS
jgi:hypothetical protein